MTRRILIVTALLAVPALAQAHTPAKGIGNFYNGLLHPVLVGPHLLVIIVFGLLLGQQGLTALRSTLPAFLIALSVGLAATVFDLSFDAELILLFASALFGILVAMERRLPLVACLILSGALGLSLGLDSSQPELSGLPRFSVLAGTAIGAVLGLTLVAGLAELPKRPWQRIGIRILGSWGTASALLVLAAVLSGENKLQTQLENGLTNDTNTVILRQP